MKKFSVIALVFMTAGCGHLQSEMTRLNEPPRQWFEKPEARARRMKIQEIEAVKRVDRGYCYKSWGGVSCYDHPIPGKEYILVGEQTPVVPILDEEAATVTQHQTQGTVENKPVEMKEIQPSKAEPIKPLVKPGGK